MLDSPCPHCDRSAAHSKVLATRPRPSQCGRGRPRQILVWLALFSCANGALAAGPPQQLPTFKPGQWQFKRTVESSGSGGKPITTSLEKCTDPSADMQKMNAALVQSSCKFTPISRIGNTYSFSADCTVRGTVLTSKSVLTYTNDSSYRIEVASSGGGQTSHETLVATRLGGCGT